MKIEIEIDCDDDALHSNLIGELSQILKTIPRKVKQILGRDSRCISGLLEAADKLYDTNGNAVGTLRIMEC